MVTTILNLELRSFQVLDVAFQHQTALMEQCQLVTDVLQFPQGVGGDDRRGSPFQHVLADQLFHKVPHYRIQPVKGFVEKQVIRTAGQCQNGCRLPPHALGELSQ